MKFSRYNNFFDFENKKVAYNAFTDKFILIDFELYNVLTDFVKQNDASKLEVMHIDFYNHLVKSGFILDDDIDEIKAVKDLAYKIDNDDSFFHLTINPTMNCNFKCWYCYETHIKDSKMSKETVDSVKNLIKNILNDNKNLKSFYLGWFGGEPLLYFDKVVLPILKYSYPKIKKSGINFSSGFTTNGLLLNEEILDLCKKLGVNHFQITLDGHRSRHDKVRFVSKKKGSYDQIVHNIKLAARKKFDISIRINVSEETIETLVNILDDFINFPDEDKKFIKFSFHEVWQEKKNINEDIQSIVNLFREKDFNTLYKGVNLDTVRKSCYADKKNHATINYNGEVYKCTARDFKSESKEGQLSDEGFINWNEKYYKRMLSKFKNKPCLSCSILPICNGGCTQQAIEHESDYCIHGFDEVKIMEVVKDKFLYNIS